MQDDPLDRDLQDAFDALPRAIAPPAGLESRTVWHLRAAGRLAPPRRSWRVWGTAAAVAVFASGFALGREAGLPSSAAPAAEYLLLLYGAEPSSSVVEAARVAEYTAWARAEAAAGHIVGGEELGDAPVVLGAARPSGTPTGYFLIAAASRSEAQATAARCPHLRHGGTVVLTSIVSREPSQSPGK